MMTFFFLVFQAIFTFGFSSIARADVTLPLDGYCRPGRFFPIRLNGEDAAKDLSFNADGCLNLQVDAGTAGSRIAPMLATQTPGVLQWVGGSKPLRTLHGNERLVASTSTDLDPDLFPGQRLIAVQLDSSDLLPGPPAAWETLDAVLLDSSVFQRITDAQRSVLLADGVVLAARGDQPDQHWPWHQQGSLWVLSYKPAGPRDEIVDESTYVPTYEWHPGWSVQIRWQVMGIATLLILVTVGILVIRRNRIATLAAIIVSLITTAAVAYWQHSLGSINRAGGDIIVAGQGLMQRDSWVYQRAKKNVIEIVPWAGWTHPMFASTAAIKRSEMKTHVAANGDLSFAYQATTDRTMAFVRREILPGVPSASSPTNDSPMEDVAKGSYVAPGTTIVGEIPGGNGRWSGVLLK